MVERGAVSSLCDKAKFPIDLLFDQKFAYSGYTNHPRSTFFDIRYGLIASRSSSCYGQRQPSKRWFARISFGSLLETF